MGNVYCYRLSAILILVVIGFTKSPAQNYPAFGPEHPVTINGLLFDAMEPHISPDGNYMFFNSLNDGITTSIYYATRVDDTTFNYQGQVVGVNQVVQPRLDGVASLDSAGQFYWISTRNYPVEFDNVFYGTGSTGTVSGIGRVHGNFYVYAPGWLIMDAAINNNGMMLYYSNAQFGSCGPIPCVARLGVAQKNNDSTFTKLPASDAVMTLVNDTNYLVYAPNIAPNGLTLYYTRIPRSTPVYSDVCVAVRTGINDTFSLPLVIYSSSAFPEGPTVTTDQSKMYYHKKQGNLYQLVLRYATNPAGITESSGQINNFVYPNPVGSGSATDELNIQLAQPANDYSVSVCTLSGQTLLTQRNSSRISLSTLPPGVYLLQIQQQNKTSPDY